MSSSQLTISFTVADYAIVCVIFISIVIGIVRGFVREALSLVVWGLAIWLGIVFGPDIAGLLAHDVGSRSVRLLIGFCVIFFVTLIAGGIASHLFVRLIRYTGIGGTDKFLGFFFGLARGALMISIIVLLAGLTKLPHEQWWRHSVLIPHFREMGQWLMHFVPHPKQFFPSIHAFLSQTDKQLMR